MEPSENASTEGINRFLSFMSRNGLNMTAQRRAIAEYFFQFPGHHTLEEFYQFVQKKDRSIGQTTVYRTLKLLCEAGLAVEIHFTDGVTRYETASSGSHHDHIVCINCQKIVEIYDNRIESIQREIAANKNFTLIGHYHVLYGLCEDCQKKHEHEADKSK